MREKRFIIKNNNTVSSNYPSERVYDNKVKSELYNSEIVIMLNKLWEENEQLRKQVESSETTSNATSHYNAFLESKINTLEEENERLKFELKRICNLECENCKEEWCEKK